MLPTEYMLAQDVENVVEITGLTISEPVDELEIDK